MEAIRSPRVVNELELPSVKKIFSNMNVTPSHDLGNLRVAGFTLPKSNKRPEELLVQGSRD